MSTVRVRFAPSPTGFMHLGNVRTAVFNYIFALQKQGTFILRIEDTDASRNLDEAGAKIFEDLSWLGLAYTEGPNIGGDFGPYFQSQRSEIYQEKLQKLIDSNDVYRCFCTVEELERKRARQRALKKPPRYDRACVKLSTDEVNKRLQKKEEFIWRLKLDQDMVVSIPTIERGTMQFHLKNFSDFAITRPDGSSTFMFANFVDDWLMGITHAIRGEDHLTNTAMQAALYRAFEVPLPVFWHLPLLSNTEGKKLSKRDFGFSLDDLRQAGYLPQAVCNYLAIIGGSFEQEILSLEELAQVMDFDHVHTTGAITYDVDKLTWVNHQWMLRLELPLLLSYVKPFLSKEFLALEHERLLMLLDKVRGEMRLLKDAEQLLAFVIKAPAVSMQELVEKIGTQKSADVLKLINDNITFIGQGSAFVDKLKGLAKEQGLKQGDVWKTVRYLLTGSFQGMGINDLFEVLSAGEIVHRLQAL